MFQSDAGVYTCQAANSEGEISGVLTVEDNEHLTETVEEFLEEVPEMIQEIQENSAATCQIPITYLLSCSLLMIRGLQRLWDCEMRTIQNLDELFGCEIQRTNKQKIIYTFDTH